MQGPPWRRTHKCTLFADFYFMELSTETRAPYSGSTCSLQPYQNLTGLLLQGNFLPLLLHKLFENDIDLIGGGGEG
jgi:hypothetical protein